MGFKYATWNFSESGHDKGAPDGVGAAVKRQADNLVNVCGKDIMKSSDLLEGLQGIRSKMTMFEIDSQTIDEYEERIGRNIKTVPNTMKIHQVRV